MTCTARIQPRTPVLGHADYTALTRQQELDHTDDTYHTDHTDEGYTRPVWNIFITTWESIVCPTCEAVCPPCEG